MSPSGELPARADGPIVIHLSDEERDTGVLSPINLFEAIDAFYTDGLVVLENAIEKKYVDQLNERMTPDTETLIANPDKIHWNQGRGKGNVSQNPPFEPKYMFPQIYANKPAGAVLANILGPRPQLRYIRTNTLVRDTAERQNVHKDCRFEHLNHPFHIALNICLCDVSPKNGSTEIWLGTPAITKHDDMRGGVDIPFGIAPEVLDERRKVRPPVYPDIERGSLVLRDIRTWHAGMPNYTDQTRIMLAFGYQARWHGADILTTLPESLKDIVADLEKTNDTEFCIKWVPDEEYDNLYEKFQVDFSSALKPEKGSAHAGVLPPYMVGKTDGKTEAY